MDQYFVSFYGWIVFHCMDIPHFIYPSSVDGHLDCFHFWAIINHVALNICIKILCGYMFSFLLNTWLGVELLGYLVTLCLTFWGLARLFFQSGCTTAFYILLSSAVRVLTFIHLSTCYYPSFYYSQASSPFLLTWSVEYYSYSFAFYFLI